VPFVSSSFTNLDYALLQSEGIHYGAEGFVALNGVVVDAPNVAENYTLDVLDSFSAD
jgi:hypothetical protein